MEKDIVNIGKSVVIKGELNGSEDLTIEGHVEGTIQLRDHVLTIGPNGRIKAQVFAKAVIVLGEVTGNVTATDKVEILPTGVMIGDIVAAARIELMDGARFKGRIDMGDVMETGAVAQPAVPNLSAPAGAQPAAAKVSAPAGARTRQR